MYIDKLVQKFEQILDTRLNLLGFIYFCFTF